MGESERKPLQQIINDLVPKNSPRNPNILTFRTGPSTRLTRAEAVEIRLRVEGGVISKVYVMANYGRVRNLAKPEEVFNLAEQFGGDYAVRFWGQVLERKNGFSHNQILFDISTFAGRFDGGGITPGYIFEDPNGIIYGVLEALGFKASRRGRTVRIAPNQRHLETLPENFAEAYRILVDGGYTPAICGTFKRSFSLEDLYERGFSLFQHLSREGHRSRTLHVGISSDSQLKDKDYKAIDDALRRGGIDLNRYELRFNPLGPRPEIPC